MTRPPPSNATTALDVRARARADLFAEEPPSSPIRVDVPPSTVPPHPIDGAPDAMVLVDDGGKIVLVNQQAERLFGYARAELLGNSIEMLVPALAVAVHPTHRAGFFRPAGAEPSAAALLELSCRRKDGTEFPAELSVARMREAEQLMLAAAIRDVTKHKRAAIRFQAFLEAAPDAIVMADRLGNVALVNAEAERLFGYPRRELVGQPVEVLVPVRFHGADPESRAAFFAHAVLETSRQQGVELVGRHKDDREFPVEISLSRVETDDGPLVSSAIRDVTERKSMEADLKRANRELEAFSYSVAHDLRAPLRGMNGFARVLLENYRDTLDARGRDWLEEIASNAERMGSLIDALLSLARIARAEMSPTLVDLSDVARAVGDQLAAREPARSVTLSIDAHLRAFVDPVLARALIENLVGNAWKFTRDVPSPRIEVGAVVLEGIVTFFVRDNGAGLDMTFAAKLFTPFQRLHRADEFPGTGIGLATAQRIVHRHEGRIWVEAEVGVGATFFFTLPHAAAGAPA